MKYLLGALILAITMPTTANARIWKQHSKPRLSFDKSYLVTEYDGSVLVEHDSSLVRPIASISKLMLAYLASEQDLNELISIPTTRKVQTKIPFKTSFLTRKELLQFTLVHSDNFAAQILCSNIPNCVDRMNEKAIEIGMVNTHYNEPTGLDNGNVSTANDLLKLLMVTRNNETITEISRQPFVIIDINGKSIKINNTNPLTSRMDISLSKTGFTNPAGGCLIMILKEKIYILLGSRNVKTRIPDMEKLVKEQM